MTPIHFLRQCLIKGLLTSRRPHRVILATCKSLQVFFNVSCSGLLGSSKLNVCVLKETCCKMQHMKLGTRRRRPALWMFGQHIIKDFWAAVSHMCSLNEKTFHRSSASVFSQSPPIFKSPFPSLFLIFVMSSVGWAYILDHMSICWRLIQWPAGLTFDSQMWRNSWYSNSFIRWVI